MTERPDLRGSDDAAQADLADLGAKTQPAEGGRGEADELPGADTTAGDEPAEESPDH